MYSVVNTDIPNYINSSHSDGNWTDDCPDKLFSVGVAWGMHLTQLLVHHYLVMCWWWLSIEGITDSLVTYCSRIMACMDMNMVKHHLSGHVYMYKMWTQFTPPFNYTTLVRCLVINPLHPIMLKMHYALLITNSILLHLQNHFTSSLHTLLITLSHTYTEAHQAISKAQVLTESKMTMHYNSSDLVWDWLAVNTTKLNGNAEVLFYNLNWYEYF